MTIKFLISDWLGKKKMTQKELAEITGIRPATISALYHDKTKRIEVEHLEKLCLVFDCQPGDLIVLERRRSNMTTIEQFLDRLEGLYKVKVVDYSFGPENGWDPLILELTQTHLMQFISKFQYNGRYGSVSYNVIGNNITFSGKIGLDIEAML